MVGNFSIDSHNSYLTNQEMSVLSAQIDMLALLACRTLKFTHIRDFFNASEQYYFKLNALISGQSSVKLESIRSSYYELISKIETDERYRNKKSLDLLLKMTKDFYHSTRHALQSEGKYYFRVSEKRDKGLTSIRYDFEGTNTMDGEE